MYRQVSSSIIMIVDWRYITFLDIIVFLDISTPWLTLKCFLLSSVSESNLISNSLALFLKSKGKKRECRMPICRVVLWKGPWYLKSLLHTFAIGSIRDAVGSTPNVNLIFTNCSPMECNIHVKYLPNFDLRDSFILCFDVFYSGSFMSLCLR